MTNEVVGYAMVTIAGFIFILCMQREGKMEFFHLEIRKLGTQLWLPLKDPFPLDTELKWSVVAYKSAPSLSVNLQLLCFMGRARCYSVVPPDMFGLGTFNTSIIHFQVCCWQCCSDVRHEKNTWVYHTHQKSRSRQVCIFNRSWMHLKGLSPLFPLLLLHKRRGA